MNLEKIKAVIDNSEVVLKGKKEQVKLVLCNILTNGHTLIEDAPGVGKTTLVKYLGKALGLEVSRIQFTNDLLPADILGSPIYNRQTSQFDFHKGPIFGELILADELNRAPPKTQSALLQAMEERSINIESKRFDLPEYFIVLATQNPHMQIGTFDLPEAQLDRFAMKIKMGYPDKEASLDLLKEIDPTANLARTEKVLNPKVLIQLQKNIKEIHLEDSLYELIYRLIEYTRNNNDLIPLSNRCGLDLVSTTKSWAFLNERDYVIPDDIHHVFPYVAGHRLVHPENSDVAFEIKLAKEVLENAG